MKLRYKGKYSGEEATLPQREDAKRAVQFREVSDMKKLALLANGVAMGITLLLVAAATFRTYPYLGTYTALGAWIGCIASMLTAFPHELLHALCFRGDVELYTNWKQGLLFVIGTEDMSKGRFVFMSLLPNLVFGVLPFTLGMIFPRLTFLTALGAVCTGMGAGDYYNVFNALTQVPKDAKVFMSGFHSYWHYPQTSANTANV